MTEWGHTDHVAPTLGIVVLEREGLPMKIVPEEFE